MGLSGVTGNGVSGLSDGGLANLTQDLLLTAKTAYTYNNFTTSNWSDSEGSTDMSNINGLTDNGTAFGGNGAVNGGSGDYGQGGVWPDFNSQFLNKWAVEFVINTTDSNSNVLGVRSSGIFEISIGDGAYASASGDGRIIIRLDDANNDSLANQTDSNYNDGSNYHVGINKVKNNGSDAFEFYINGSQVSSSSAASNNTLSADPSFSRDFAYFAMNDEGNISRDLSADIRKIAYYDQNLTSSEWTNQYNNQPWS